MSKPTVAEQLEILARGTAEITVNGVLINRPCAVPALASATWADGEPITVTLPIKTVGSNGREHWRAKSARVKSERESVELALLPYIAHRDRFANGCIVRMCRIGRKVDDDNLYGYCKHVRDAVAMWLLGGTMGQRDDDPRIEWDYSQRSCGRASGVILTLEVKT